MAIGAILDPRQKMRLISFPKIYSPFESEENLTKVWKALFDFYEEYVVATGNSSGTTIVSHGSASDGQD